PEDRAHRELEPVPGTRDAKPRTARHGAREPCVLREVLADARGVRGHVEEASRAGGDADEIRGQAATDGEGQRAVARARDMDGRILVEGARITRRRDALDAGEGARRKEREDAFEVVGEHEGDARDEPLFPRRPAVLAFALAPKRARRL